MTLDQLITAFAPLTDSEESCRFFKRCGVMEPLTKSQLVTLANDAGRRLHPNGGGWFTTASKVRAMSKLDVMRHVDSAINLLEKHGAGAIR